jgi:hypothetical protein
VVLGAGTVDGLANEGSRVGTISATTF